MEQINQSEMVKVIFGLRERNIEFTVCSYFDGIQIRCADWDCICHKFSYGGKDGLIEVMGLPQCNDDVIGFLTAEELLKMVDEGV